MGVNRDIINSLTTRPYPYQREGVSYLLKIGKRALLGDEMGLGKSIQGLSFSTIMGTYTLIVCPASLKYSWADEIEQHTNKSCHVIEGVTVGALPNVHYIIINYDILRFWKDNLISYGFDTMMCDECHFLSNQTTHRTKAVKHLSMKIPNFLAITGTPISNRPVHLYPVLNIIAPKLFGSFRRFTIDYCMPVFTSRGWEYKGASNRAELKDKLSTIMVRRKTRDVLPDLPELTRQIIPIKIDMKAYMEMETNFVQWIRDNKPKKMYTAFKADFFVKLGYLQRYAAELKVKQAIKCIEDMITAHGKVVVFGIHKEVLDKIQAHFGKSLVRIDGSVSSKNRHKAVKAFQENEKVKVFLGNIKAAGVGITLTASHCTIFLEYSWLPGEFLQAEKRVLRIGQKASEVFAIYLAAMGTVDIMMIKCIQNKQADIDAILSGDDTAEWDLMTLLMEDIKRKPKTRRKNGKIRR